MEWNGEIPDERPRFRWVLPTMSYSILFLAIIFIIWFAGGPVRIPDAAVRRSIGRAWLTRKTGPRERLSYCIRTNIARLWLFSGYYPKHIAPEEWSTIYQLCLEVRPGEKVDLGALLIIQELLPVLVSFSLMNVLELAPGSVEAAQKFFLVARARNPRFCYLGFNDTNSEVVYELGPAAPSELSIYNMDVDLGRLAKAYHDLSGLTLWKCSWTKGEGLAALKELKRLCIIEPLYPNLSLTLPLSMEDIGVQRGEVSFLWSEDASGYTQIPNRLELFWGGVNRMRGLEWLKPLFTKPGIDDFSMSLSLGRVNHIAFSGLEDIPEGCHVNLEVRAEHLESSSGAVKGLDSLSWYANATLLPAAEDIGKLDLRLPRVSSPVPAERLKNIRALHLECWGNSQMMVEAFIPIVWAVEDGKLPELEEVVLIRGNTKKTQELIDRFERAGVKVEVKKSRY